MPSSSSKLQQVLPCVVLGCIALHRRALGCRRIRKPLNCCIYRNICLSGIAVRLKYLKFTTVNYIRFQKADILQERKDNMTLLQIGRAAHAAERGPPEIWLLFFFFELKN